MTDCANPSLDDAWLPRCRQLVSPNFNARPAPNVIDLLVIHNISLPAAAEGGPEFGAPYIDQLFTNTLNCSTDARFRSLSGVRVSSHFLIQRTGLVTQYVGINQRAWHAGVSQFEGRDNCNDFSIGIELEGTDELPFEAVQYDSLLILTQQVVSRYPIRAITGHQHIAPLRKTDPGPCFDWLLYQDNMRQLGLEKIQFAI